MRLLLASTTCLLFLLAACAAPRTAVVPPQAALPAPPPFAADEVARGTAVYATYCAECHGAELEGEADWKVQNEDGSFRAPPHTAAGHTWHHPDSVLRAAIREGGARFAGQEIGGSSAMPPYAGTLTEAEVTAVLSFIKSTWPEDVRAVQWAQTLQEQALAPAAN